MTKTIEKFIKLEDLYIAYRKAKVQAFYESTHPHSVEFTDYEQNLEKNLLALYIELKKNNSNWYKRLNFIGGFAYLPKSVDTSKWNNSSNGHFCALNPLDDWEASYQHNGTKPQAKLRLIIRPSVNYQIVSALWIIKVGHKFDSILNRKISHGNRLRRVRKNESSEINLASTGLFEPYFSAYRGWREKGLESMKTALESNQNILAITMDVKQFYHNVNADFLLREDFLEKSNITLSTPEKTLTKYILKSIKVWYQSTPDYEIRPEGGLPVGLSASSVIANVLLNEFDREVVNNVEPIYYGRYVDDVFLVFKNEKSLTNSNQVIEELATRIPSLSLKPNNPSPPSLKLNLTYASDSEIEFSGDKQKIFALSSSHGLDLILQIRNQIRAQSSEYRLLPEIPDTGAEMATKTLLATPDASLQVDALRKADTLSIKRLGFSLLLSDLEAYSSDLEPSSWEKLRSEFYELTNRYLITPKGFFDYVSFIPRVFGLMLTNGDIKLAGKLIDDIKVVIKLLSETTSLGEPDQINQFKLCIAQYALALKQAGLQAGTEAEEQLDHKYLRVLKKLTEIDKKIKIPRTLKSLKKLVHQILLADWGRQPYKNFWYQQQGEAENGPKVPKSFRIRRQLRLGAIRHFREKLTNLVMPHWPALAFPTRPLKLDEIVMVAPSLIEDPAQLKIIVHLLRGAKVISSEKFGLENIDGIKAVFHAPNKPFEKVVVALTNIETTFNQWEKAASGKPDKSHKRYVNLFRSINKILKEKTKPHYVVIPELAIPKKWAIRMARKLALNNISLLAGVEYYKDRKKKVLRNDCLVSLTTDWPGYRSHIIRFQPKFQPAEEERQFLKNGGFSKISEPEGIDKLPSLYQHGNFIFSILICSDLTNISHRNTLRGEIDALFVPEWNMDLNTFSPLVEASALDLHCYIVQCNNRKYGDSRIRAPFAETYYRDVVRLKGGISDYYVMAEIDYKSLREAQRKAKSKPKKSSKPPTTALFKPIPIGYRMSATRFNIG
jgi:hypothetical protein